MRYKSNRPKSTNHFIFGNFHQMAPWQIWAMRHFWGSVLSLGFCLCSTPKEKYSNLALVFSSFKVRFLNTQGFRLELFGLFFTLWTFSFLWLFSVFASKPFMILWLDRKIWTSSRGMRSSERSRCPNATPSLITQTSINWMFPSHRNSTFLPPSRRLIDSYCPSARLPNLRTV